jgi:hypothetical protein
MSDDLRHVEDRCGVRYNSPAKLTDVCRLVSPCFLPSVSAGICQRAVVDESGMIRTQMATRNRSKRSQCMGRFVRYHPATVTSNLYADRFRAAVGRRTGYVTLRGGGVPVTASVTASERVRTT